MVFVVRKALVLGIALGWMIWCEGGGFALAQEGTPAVPAAVQSPEATKADEVERPLPDIPALIGTVRQQELDVLQQGLQRMLDCLSGHDRICAVLHNLYGKQTLRACGGCPGCRRLGRPAR